jgi:hypothetical protein
MTPATPLPGYGEVNAAWNCDTKTMRKPTDKEALKACRLLIAEGYRAFGDGRKAPKHEFKITRGRNHTWKRNGIFYVNPDEDCEGFAEIVHSVSHWIHRRCQPRHGAHSFHASIEKHLVQFVIKKRWIQDGLKVRATAIKPRQDIREMRKAKIQARLKAWQAKQKRANNAVKKLQKQLRRYENA